MNLPFEGYLRRKDAYQAADAGIVLWRKNFAYFILFFAIPFWICAFVLRMLPGRWMYFSWIVLWYLKPFFDRTILHVISIRFFEPDASLKRLLKGLGGNLCRGLFGDLLWRRFNPFRAASLPLRVLEQPFPVKKKAKKFNERKKLLGKGGLGYCFILTFWGLAMEAALLAGEILFIFMMARFIGKEFDFAGIEIIINFENYIFALWCFNYILLESIYVCMGFGVYINSRIEVEGWDIEILFKGFAEKLKKKKALGVLSLFCFLLIFIPCPASAQSKEDKVPLDKLEEVLASPDFGGEKDTWDIRLRNPPDPKENIIVIRYSRNEFLNKIRYIFAAGLRFFLIAAFIVIFLIIYFITRRYLKKKIAKEKPKPALSIFKEITPEDPQDILNKAMEFYKQKDLNEANLRLAWGYCTAAVILSVQLYRGIVFPPNATENECADIVKVKLADTDEEKKFRLLIKTWVSFAYAGRLPADESFIEAINLCKSLYSEKEAANG